MTNPDGNTGQTPASGPGSQPPEPLSTGYEAPFIEQSQDRPQSAAAQPSYQFPPPNYGSGPSYPPAVDYPSDIPHGYAPQPGYPQPGYPPPGYPPPGFPPPGPVDYNAPGYPGYAGYPGGYGMPPANPTNSLAIGSLVASILSLVLFVMCGIGLLLSFVGIGLGVTALNQIKQSGQAGRGPAIAGICTGALGVVVNGAVLLFFLVGLSAS